MANYTIPTNPIYNATIRKLEDSDPASASTIFNPLIQQLIENTHAVKKSVPAGPTGGALRIGNALQTVAHALVAARKLRLLQIFHR